MRRITGTTSLVALLGQPVSHSLSPIMHNAGLKEMGLDWCYLAIPCETKDLPLIAKALIRMNCKGLNITIPHKQTALSLCSEISQIAQEIQAVNTLIPNLNSSWTGTNTDVEGFVSPLQNKNLENKNALILGSGGSARAVLAGLKTLKLSKITIASRNQNSLENLIKDAEKFSPLTNETQPLIKGIVHDDFITSKEIRSSNLIINTTPVGMTTDQNPSQNFPFGKEIWHNLEKGTILYDLIYNPRPTNWLKLGLEKNCLILDGLEMLVQQGAASLQLWSGYEDIPIAKMRLAAKEYFNH